MKNILILLSLSIVLFSCENQDQINKPVQEHVVSSSVSNSSKIVVKTIDGGIVGEFSLNPIMMNVNGNNYSFKAKPGKHKFYVNGIMTYEVKFKDDGFKLRDKNSNLLWKIKIYADKIKISDNEENLNSYEIKNYEDKIKIKRDGEELYRVILSEGVVEINKEEKYLVNNRIDSYAWAVLAIKEIKLEHRLFIIAELLKKV